MVVTGTSGAIPEMAYTFIPMGGVINAISVIPTSITPNHIGSKPKLIARGKKIGMVRADKIYPLRRKPRLKHLLQLCFRG